MQILPDALLLPLAGIHDIPLQLPHLPHIGEPGLHAIAVVLDAGAADRNESEEEDAHGSLPNLDPPGDIVVPAFQSAHHQTMALTSTTSMAPLRSEYQTAKRMGPP